jgi:acyl-CoA hydrolase
METHRLVLPEDLNHFGFLFGGRLLAWVDEACWIAASLDFPHCQFVTIGMDTVEFRYSVRQGTILNIRCTKENEGTTSVSYRVEVFDRRNSIAPPIFSTGITYVSVDDSGRKRPIR